MKPWFRLFLTLNTLLSTTIAAAASMPTVHAVAVDPLIKIFRNSPVTGKQVAQMESARGEHATFQVVVTSCPVEMKDLTCKVTTFSKATGNKTLPPAQVRYVGYIATSATAKKPAQDQLRSAPAMFPDPLLEMPAVDVEAGDNQACWISLKIPVDTEPGDYRATSVIHAKIFGFETSATIPLELKIYPATVKKTRLNVTNWYQMDQRGDLPSPEKYSPEYWQMLRTYIRNMVDHRQNWARVETLRLLNYHRDASGKMQLDFSNFDKWMQILFDEGIDKAEGLQFAWRGGKWKERYVVEIHKEGEAGANGTHVAPDSPEAKQFYREVFPKLFEHLKEKGWSNKYVQHVGDEPVEGNTDSYTTAAGYVRKYMPGVPIMEACLSHQMVGVIDIWVPILGHLDSNYSFFKERAKAGDKVWFYTCVQPQGEYANRFLELPLIKTRLLHWINYRYGIEGYLHWGYNFWRPHPWENATHISSTLPGGDPAIVYPAREGYGVVDSIRWEAMRDGIEDHELLSQLGEKDPDAAMEMAKSVVLDFDKYNTDVRHFRMIRHDLLEALQP